MLAISVREASEKLGIPLTTLRGYIRKHLKSLEEEGYIKAHRAIKRISRYEILVEPEKLLKEITRLESTNEDKSNQ
ncbi:hypothetical protein [Desulfurobacterium sp.]